MYEAFYGLNDKPFQSNPDPSFYYGSRQHQRAMAYLEYGLYRNDGFVVVTGEVGAGKTTLVRNLLGKLDGKNILLAHLVSSHLDAENALRMVSAAFGLKINSVNKADLLIALESFLVDAHHAGKRCLLIVDEAQNLTMSAVEELRMLSNFQHNRDSLLQSFLVGQPEFRNTLQSPHMVQLRQRVIAACHIGPLDENEVQAYVEHRLSRAGWIDFPQFLPDSFPAIHLASGGIPRRINAICDRLLLSGMLSNQRTFGRADVVDVAKEFGDETFAPAMSPITGVPQTLAASSSSTGDASSPGSAIEGLSNDVLLRQSLIEARIAWMETSLEGLLLSNHTLLKLLGRLAQSVKTLLDHRPS